MKTLWDGSIIVGNLRIFEVTEGYTSFVVAHVDGGWLDGEFASVEAVVAAYGSAPDSTHLAGVQDD